MINKVYLPYVSNQYQLRKGIGLTYGTSADLTALRCDWWYNWDMGAIGDSHYVPLTKTGLPDSRVPADYPGYILFLNEPEYSTQSNLTPIEAASRYNAFVTHYPQAKIIAGGIGRDGYKRGWLEIFRSKINKQPMGWHLHSYLELGVELDFFLEMWDYYHLNFDGEIWLTEFNDVDQTDPDRFETMLNEIVSRLWIDRYAVFTNRCTGLDWWWPKHWPSPDSINMMTVQGELTDRGKIYQRMVK